MMPVKKKKKKVGGCRISWLSWHWNAARLTDFEPKYLSKASCQAPSVSRVESQREWERQRRLNDAPPRPSRWETPALLQYKRQPFGGNSSNGINKSSWLRAENRIVCVHVIWMSIRFVCPLARVTFSSRTLYHVGSVRSFLRNVFFMLPSKEPL